MYRKEPAAPWALYSVTVSILIVCLLVVGKDGKAKVAEAKKRAELAEAKYAEVEKHLPRILDQAKAQGVISGMEMGCAK